MYNQIMWV